MYAWRAPRTIRAELFVALGARRLVGARDRTARHHADEVRPILGAAVDIAVQAGRRHRHSLERLRREALLERLLEFLHSEYPAGAGAGDGNADLRAALRREHADQRETRGLVAELFVAGLLGKREAHLGDDLVRLE